jgi:hypothetical protein
MTIRRLSTLQWLAFFVGGPFWFAQHIAGFGITVAKCGDGTAQRALDNPLAQGIAMGITIALILAAEAAAVAVLRGTSNASYEDAPPVGRVRLIAIAAAAANAIFLMIVVLDGTATIFFGGCRQG